MRKPPEPKFFVVAWPEAAKRYGASKIFFSETEAKTAAELKVQETGATTVVRAYGAKGGLMKTTECRAHSERLIKAVWE